MLGTVGRLLRTDRLTNVHPALRSWAADYCEGSPYTWMVVTGVRTRADVELKYAIGRTTPGAHAGEPGCPAMGETVTRVCTLDNAPHAIRCTPEGVWGCAMDLQFFTGDGLRLAEGKAEEEQGVYREMGEAAERAGFVWGGRFRHLFDQAHVELLDWRRYELPAPIERG